MILQKKNLQIEIVTSNDLLFIICFINWIKKLFLKKFAGNLIEHAAANHLAKFYEIFKNK